MGKVAPSGQMQPITRARDLASGLIGFHPPPLGILMKGVDYTIVLSSAQSICSVRNLIIAITWKKYFIAIVVLHIFTLSSEPNLAKSVAKIVEMHFVDPSLCDCLYATIWKIIQVDVWLLYCIAPGAMESEMNWDQI